MRPFASLAAFLSLSVLWVPPLQAGECVESETLQACYDRLVVLGTEQADESEQEAELIEKPTGASTSGPSFSSTTQDYLPWLTFAGFLSESEEGSAEGVAAFDVNLPFLTENDRKNLKLRAIINTEPTVSEAVQGLLPEDGRADLVEKLQGALTDVDDYRLSLTYSPQNMRFGRSFSPFRSTFAAFARQARAGVSDEHALDATQKFMALVQENSDDHAYLPRPLSEWPEEAAKATADRIAEAALAVGELNAASAEALSDHGLEQFAALLANQQQLTVGIEQTIREELVGGDSFGSR